MAFSRDKQIVVAVVVLGALGAAVYFQQKKDSRIGVAPVASSELPTVSGTDDLDKFEIQNGEKGQVVLEKKDDKWWVTKPVTAIANQSNLKQLIDNLKEVKVTEVVASNVGDDIKKSYELDPSKAVHVVGYKLGDKKVDDWFGKSGSRGEMMMVEGKSDVYSVSGFAVYMYNREVKAWRDNEIFKFDEATANTITIDNTHGLFSFTKADDKWKGTWKGQPIERYDEDKPKTMLMAFKALNAEDFGDGKGPFDTGLDKPEATSSTSARCRPAARTTRRRTAPTRSSSWAPDRATGRRPMSSSSRRLPTRERRSRTRVARRPR
jgi:hypothetical protein